MNITTKLLLRKDRANELGLCPVVMRFTINRKSSYANTRQLVHPDNWLDAHQNVKKGVQSYRDLHLYFETWKSNVSQAILVLKNKRMPISQKSIMELIEHGEPSDDFIEFIERELEAHGSDYASGTLRHYKSKLKRLREYAPQINMHMMDYNFLRGYKKHLEQSIKAYSTVHAHLKFVRAMNNQAIRQGLTKNYAFVNFPMPDPKVAKKEFLVKEERQKLWDLLYGGELPGYLQKTLHFFLIACYAGMRESDWSEGRSKNVKGKILKVSQTKKKGAIVRVPLNKYSKKLIEDLPSHYHKITNQRNNNHLKEIMVIAGIDKHITTHCARHTFVVMCLNEAKIPIKVVAEFVDDTVKTLEKHYAQYLDEFKIDEMGKLDDL